MRNAGLQCTIASQSRSFKWVASAQFGWISIGGVAGFQLQKKKVGGKVNPEKDAPFSNEFLDGLRFCAI